jgi:hypothetical protein
VRFSRQCSAAINLRMLHGIAFSEWATPSRSEPFAATSGDRFADCADVKFLNIFRRMCELLRQRSIVHQNHKSFAFLMQPCRIRLIFHGRALWEAPRRFRRYSLNSRFGGDSFWRLHFPGNQ